MNDSLARYRIVRPLGRGATSTTYEVVDLRTGRRAALKRFSLHDVTDWSAVDRFEREARLLAALDHPGIPHYLAHAREESEGDCVFSLVQAIADGRSIAERVKSGWRATEAEAEDIAAQLLDVLVYLQRQNPPLVHRDIKPQHVIVRGDGRVCLVDFGAVQAAYTDTVLGGATITGTLGYMAPEQLRKKAGPATDLYSLGATILFAITGREPGEFPMRRGRLEIDGVPPRLRRWIARSMEPIAEDRPRSAADALALLRPPRSRWRALRLAAAPLFIAGALSLGISFHPRPPPLPVPPARARATPHLEPVLARTDHDRSSIRVNAGLGSISTTQERAQTFVADVSGEIGSIEVLVQGSGAKGALVLDLRRATGGAPDAGITGESTIATSSLPVSAIGRPAAYVVFSLASPIRVQRGEALAIVLHATAGDAMFGWLGSARPADATGFAFERDIGNHPWIIESKRYQLGYKVNIDAS